MISTQTFVPVCYVLKINLTAHAYVVFILVSCVPGNMSYFGSNGVFSSKLLILLDFDEQSDTNYNVSLKNSHSFNFVIE